MIPTVPPTRIETWLNSLSNDQLAALFLGVCVFAFAVGMAVSIVRIIRREREAEKALAGQRLTTSIATLERECGIGDYPRTVAVSSSRKSGRVSSR